MPLLSTIGQRQQSLLKALLHSSAGLTVDELANELAISRNAVNQHLASLEGNGFVKNTSMSSTGGRPSKIYTLTGEGKELFPRHYALFSNLLIRLLKEKMGEQTLTLYLAELGSHLADEFKGRMRDKTSLSDRVAELTTILYELGYEAQLGKSEAGQHEIIASNCVFHKLAEEFNTVCELDLALMSSVLDGAAVDHLECMAKGESCCRFVILDKS